jgi:hypothetical protein
MQMWSAAGDGQRYIQHSGQKSTLFIAYNPELASLKVFKSASD